MPFFRPGQELLPSFPIPIQLRPFMPPSIPSPQGTPFLAGPPTWPFLPVGVDSTQFPIPGIISGTFTHPVPSSHSYRASLTDQPRFSRRQLHGRAWSREGTHRQGLRYLDVRGRDRHLPIPRPFRPRRCELSCGQLDPRPSIPVVSLGPRRRPVG